MSTGLVLPAIAVLIAAAMWVSLHVVPMTDLDALPARCRHRITWWQRNARWMYIACAVLATGSALIRISA